MDVTKYFLSFWKFLAQITAYNVKLHLNYLSNFMGVLWGRVISSLKTGKM
jgi:hypothetical protein